MLPDCCVSPVEDSKLLRSRGEPASEAAGMGCRCGLRVTSDERPSSASEASDGTVARCRPSMSAGGAASSGCRASCAGADPHASAATTAARSEARANHRTVLRHIARSSLKLARGVRTPRGNRRGSPRQPGSGRPQQAITPLRQIDSMDLGPHRRVRNLPPFNMTTPDRIYDSTRFS